MFLNLMFSESKFLTSVVFAVRTFFLIGYFFFYFMSNFPNFQILLFLGFENNSTVKKRGPPKKQENTCSHILNVLFTIICLHYHVTSIMQKKLQWIHNKYSINQSINQGVQILSVLVYIFNDFYTMLQAAKLR